MKKIILVLVIFVILAAIGYGAVNREKGVTAPVASAPSVWETGTGEPAPASYDLSTANSKEFRDAGRGFSFRYPNHLSVSNFADASGGEIILVQSPEQAEGFQIAISPFDEPGTTLTADMIERDIPDLAIRDSQDLLLGETGKGVAFISDNPSFGGNSREVWFVYGGDLYQISTYARLDPLLQSVLGTWKFE